ncbi:MAG: GAF domain-containing protein [Anaerolineae bacterium]|nr:MAG: GAF domain-containing protein [Anaerolineae bacterium]
MPTAFTIKHMDEVNTSAPAVPAVSGRRVRLLPLGVLAFQLLALAALAAAPLLAWQWSRNAFAGLLLEPNLVLSDLGPVSAGAWRGPRPPVPAGAQLIAVEGQPVLNAQDFAAQLAGRIPGELIELDLRAADGAAVNATVQLQQMPIPDRLAYLYLPYTVGLAFLALGLWALNLRRNDRAGRAFSLFAAALALVLGGLFDFYSTHRLVAFWLAGFAVMGGSLLHLALVFPRPARLVVKLPWLAALGYVAGGGLAINALIALNQTDAPFTFRLGLNLLLAFAAVSGALLLARLLWTRFRSPSPTDQQQTRVTLLAAGLGFAPLALWGMARLAGLGSIPLPLVLLPGTLFPAGLAAAILRLRTASTDAFVRRALVYAILTILAGAGYAALVSGASLVLADVLRPEEPALLGALVFALALVFNPLRTRLERVINAVFFRGDAAQRAQIELFEESLARAMETGHIVSELRQKIENDLQPGRLHVFVYNASTDLYEAAPDSTRRPTTDIRFARSSPLAVVLRESQPALFIGAAEPLPPELGSEKARLALLGAQLYVALPGQQRLEGWLALGPRRGGEPYTGPDVSYLTALAEEAGLALSRGQVLADKDRRVLEMNVLTRVAQGVNITLDFDDILELIYAQARQVIPLTDFSITLYDVPTGGLRHVFYVEEDERLEEQEQRLIPPGRGLARLVLESGRHIAVDDYERACRAQRVLPAKEGIFAWMGVPLNAGAETIGVVSVSSRDAAVRYTDDQRGILQAISDQAAGAIVKARLLEESQKRTRQLGKLNEVAQSLSSTLEIKPLLDNILRSAVEILNCEAGSLLTLDEETGELVFDVVVGSAESELKGTRMASGSGLVGKAVNDRQPFIVNNVKQSQDWEASKDKETGFITRGILGVPMMVKDRVLGVIEVINKKDGMPFSQDDLELLTAFTGQAAIALENARLYTLTDQQLASRVEELSVMQRIDRELNTSLDVSRAMRITLEWAVRQSAAVAGLVGVVSEAGLRLVASEGYETELEAYRDTGILPPEMPALAEALRTGRVQLPDPKTLRLRDTLLAGAQGQFVIPIRRETDVIGLLLLESVERNAFDEDAQAFLIRLADHAAIAIANAQLYAEVQRANIAKSDFVSFVSHELKTPMTSIRGYADLLAAGAVGPVTEAQSEFISTIRSNVSRMATLVSDLADVSRIEAGRLHLEFAGVKVSEVVEEVVRSTRALFDEKQQELVVDLPEDLPLVWGDRNRMVQVMTNLTSNANKYTLLEGKVTIKARRTRNEWDPQGADEVVHIQIQDTGIGIKEEDQKYIFTQYFRTEEGKDTAPGTGLGLNIARNLVEMQGGKIWFESILGKGTTFQFTVPVADPELVAN